MASVGRIALHHWIELPDGKVVDLRVRMWLGDDARVPHGIVMPSEEVRYRPGGQLTAAQLWINPPIFEVMTGQSLESVMPNCLDAEVDLFG